MHSGDGEIRMQAGGWAIVMGAVGFGIGSMLSFLTGTPPLISGIIGAVVGGGGVYWFVSTSSEVAGGVARRIYDPQGDTTPPIREYSEAQTLVQHGHYEDAVEAYELHHLQHPGDPEPCLRLARLHRDTLGDYELASHWFKQARLAQEATRGQQLMVLQELIELYTGKMEQPRLAMPELARLLDKYPDSPGAPAASRELADMRALLRQSEQDGTAFETLYYQARRPVASEVNP